MIAKIRFKKPKKEHLKRLADVCKKLDALMAENSDVIESVDVEGSLK